jgi:23S rRNA pseudouridine1911/1915/1917 synthase
MGLGRSPSGAILSKTSFDYMVQPQRRSAENPLAAEAGASDDELDVEIENPGAAIIERREAQVSRALHGSRLDKVVVTMANEFSRNRLQDLIEGGHVFVDGVAASTSSRRVLAGQVISVDLVPTAESQAFRPEELPIDIVFEDDQLLVVDKAAGMVVHPAAGNWSGTLLNALLAHHKAAARLPRAGIVHRLDKDTSGLMMVGKTLESVTALSRAIAQREVSREYLAISHGEVRPQAFSIDAPIGRDPQVRVRMAIVATGKPARTDVMVMHAGDGVSALRCKLHTGRTHQIRVHLASRGYPLVADALYAGRPALGMTRQALHAERLAFVHPISGLPMAFESNPPPDFASAWNNVTGGLTKACA